MSDTQNNELDVQRAKVSFIDGLIKEKSELISKLLDGAKGVEGYSIGSRETSEKIEVHVKQHKKELFDLFVQQQINGDAYRFMDNIINSFSSIAKSVSSEAEKLLFSKQCELTFLNQELERLKTLRANEVRKLSELEALAVMAKKRDRQHRPDRDPNTSAGRAAMDLAERRKKGKIKSSLS